jgi:hypothetical protein
MHNPAESTRKRFGNARPRQLPSALPPSAGGTRFWWIAPVLLGALAVRCSSTADAITTVRRKDVGPGGSREGGGGPGGTGGAAGFQTNPDGGSAQTVSVHVDDHNHVVIDLITLRCDGECADVEAVASGGYEPYTYVWEDGSTNPARHVCSSAVGTLLVSATDSGTKFGEFPRAAKTVDAQVTRR